MEIKEAQKLVKEHLDKIGYTKIETTPTHAFLHLIEEVGEVARAILHKETNRASLHVGAEPEELEDEIADIFWQTLKLASYLNMDLESIFLEKYKKNKDKKK
ncbi:MAG: nucleotide pyrophosphohydrolase [Candidatus Nealsonbacteria bacterium]|nr:nucleotide pyrophosphohydrolase [Candidatus Nealsonbacteria bacterium]